MGMTLLITGANGFVGKNLVRALAADPDLTVVATDIHDTLNCLDESSRAKVSYVSGDLALKETARVLREEHRFDVIIHLAAVLSQAEDMSTYFSVMDSNIYTTFLLMETARAHGARVILPSTGLVYGDKEAPFTETMPSDPAVFYAMSKYMSEELIRFYHRKYGVGYLIFRIGIFYGPGQPPASPMFVPSLISHLLDGKDFPMTGGDQVRDFVFIGDFVDLVHKALARSDVNGLFNVGTGHAPTIKEVVLMAEKLTGVSGKVRPGAVPYRKEEVWKYCLDISKARTTFNWEPNTDLEHGLQQTIEYQKRVKRE